MRRILTQSEMDRVKRSFENCYICGAALANQGPCQGEHVIPKSMLGPLPALDADRWPVVLPAHRECDATRKRQGDVLARSIIQGHNLGAASLPPEDLAEFYKHLSIEPEFAGDVERRPAISGMAPVLDSMSLWAKGMYAATYAALLDDTTTCTVIPPVPTCMSNASLDENNRFIAAGETVAHAIEDILAACDTLDCWDGVVAWGRTLSFQCVWMLPHSLENPARARCVWRLDFFGVRQWSKTVCAVPRPVAGVFETQSMPSNCSLVPPEAFQRASTARAARHPYLPMWPLPSSSSDSLSIIRRRFRK